MLQSKVNKGNNTMSIVDDFNHLIGEYFLDSDKNNEVIKCTVSRIELTDNSVILWDDSKSKFIFLEDYELECYNDETGWREELIESANVDSLVF